MNVSIFSENFWGERNHGYDILYHNMKHGQTSSKELADFIRERASIEENYSKSLTKLAKNVSNYPSLGTFSPLWSTVRTSSEKLASLHAESAKRLQEIVKELQKYTEEQHKKHKSAKDDFSGTADVVQLIQTTTVNLQKAKETYNSRCTEYEKIRKEGASQRELEKAENKYKKASEEYKSLVEKYASIRTDFISKMTVSSKQFQQLEEAHLKRMKALLKDYNATFIQGNSTVSNILSEFEQQCGVHTTEKLIMEYVENKRTGTDRPGEIQFEECPITIVPSPEIQLGQKDKSKKKKDKRKKKKDKEQTQDGNSRTPQVDEEGFSIRPQEINAENKRDSFYSDSDSDSDQDDPRGKKIHVEIKPVAPSNNSSGTAVSIDQLRASVTAISLTPSPTMRKYDDQKVSNLIETERKPSADLLDLNLFSSSSTGILSPPGSLTSPSSGIDSWNSSSNGITPPALPIKQSKLNSTSSLSEVKIPPPGGIPRPPSRNRGIFGQSSISPVNEVASLPRKDSFPSMSTSFDANGATVGASRGPSPLTLGKADTIPMAAAFTENVNAYFKGTDTTKCMVKITGELVLSFPAGIIQALTNNPSPAVISFKVKNFNNLEQILPNKQLITLDTIQSTTDAKIFSFNMAALIALLKRQSDQNATATYFNVDIIKYQVKCLPGAQSVPLHLSTYWKCEPKLTELRIDYCYNQVVSPPIPLTDVQLLLPVDGGVTIMQSRPPAIWSAESHRVLWKINKISKGGDSQAGDSKSTESQGSLRAKFELTDGPSTPSIMAVQFQSEGSTISGLDIELLGSAYRLSLVKKKFHSGRFICER